MDQTTLVVTIRSRNEQIDLRPKGIRHENVILQLSSFDHGILRFFFDCKQAVIFLYFLPFEYHNIFSNEREGEFTN